MSALRSPLLLIAVTAAGYFVDIYDLLLFSIVRVKSLRELGLSDEALLSQGVMLLNLQMAGLLLGGLFWGILGDRKGRITVLFGSILTYSSANLLNAGILHLPSDWTLPAYGALRFIAGVGLAGELGAAVTLVSEACSKERRGVATAFVASTGIAGAVFAGWVAEHTHWTEAYFLGGVLGLLLLFTRVQLHESGLYESMEKNERSHRRGDWWSLLIESRLRGRYLGAIAQGMPIWFVVGVLLTFSPEIGKELRISGTIEPGRLIMYCYAGAVAGDFLAGLWSQWLGSRKKAIATFLVLTAFGLARFVSFHDQSFENFCLLAGAMGFASGYWAVLLSSTAEQFGTNLRSTVSSTVPNFIRATVIPMSWLFLTLGRATSLLIAAVWVSAGTLGLAGLALFHSRETFGADLNFIEEEPSGETILFFDGVCGLCNRTVDLLLGLGAGGRMRFAPLQGETSRARLPAELRPDTPGSLVLLYQGKPKILSEAALLAGVLTGGFVGFLSLLILRLIPRLLADAIYRFIAARRYQWFGRREQCRLPEPHERSFFLP